MTQRTALYRYLDTEGQPLYIGITSNVKERKKSHAQSRWDREASSFTVEWFDSTQAALAAELSAIKTEKPAYNRAHNFGDITLDKVDWPSLADAHRTKAIQLAELMRVEIESGRWPVGHRIPRPDELASAVDIGFGTAMHAITKLIREGHVYLRRGYGHFVRRRPQSNG